MLHWFGRNFEDPANETPHSSADGGYQYVWGGPYDALEQLGDEFGDLVSQKRLEEAVSVVERDGIVDWAPGPAHPDHQLSAEEWEAEEHPDVIPDLDKIVGEIEAGAQMRFGDSYELAERNIVAENIAILRQALEEHRPAHGGIGHNMPPGGSDEALEKATEIAAAAESISEEINKPEPDALAVGRSAQTLKGIVGWAAEKADMAVDEFMKTLAKGIAAAVVVGLVGIWADVLQAVQSVVSAATNWLSTITLPF